DAGLCRLPTPHARLPGDRTPDTGPLVRLACPKCGCDDPSMIEVENSGREPGAGRRDPEEIMSGDHLRAPHAPRPTPDSRHDRSSSSGQYFCNVCSHEWALADLAPRRFHSIDELIRVTGLRRDEVTALAEIGALNSFGLDRRSALWQAERAVRPAGELFTSDMPADDESRTRPIPQSSLQSPITNHQSSTLAQSPDRSTPNSSTPNSSSPLPAMTPTERLVADYAGTGLTLGPHPMSLRRHELSMRGVLRAIDLPRARAGRRVRTAGMVITRQRPGTAKGFVFLTLEDETGISNIIIRPDLYAATRLIVVESPFLLVDGVLQNQDGVTSIRAERLQRLDGLSDEASVESHDFY
ncbi:MAG: hypothetical protein OEW19_17870, partial [Acidobacteriota bacterium]|nr:hypothetical protein [Acidobacteriota bacterium]